MPWKNDNLNEKTAAKVRDMYRSGRFFIREIAAKFKISPTACSNIINNYTYPDAGTPLSPEEIDKIRHYGEHGKRLSKKQIDSIRVLLETKTVSEIARMLGSSRQSIHAIVKRHNMTVHVKGGQKR